MNCYKLAMSGLAALAVIFGVEHASAETLALYDFEEFTTTATAWPASAGPWNNSATSAAVTATTLSDNDFAILEARSVRDASVPNTDPPNDPGDLQSFAALIGAGSITGGDPTPAPTSDADYFTFSVTAAAPIELSTFSFELGVSNTDNNTMLNHNVRAQVFYNINGGAFSAIGAEQTRATSVGPDDEFTGMLLSSIDLSGISLANGQTAEFRLSLRNNRGFSSNAGAVYLDNVQLEGTVVPEPASLALIGLAGLALGLLRRVR